MHRWTLALALLAALLFGGTAGAQAPPELPGRGVKIDRAREVLEAARESGALRPDAARERSALAEDEPARIDLLTMGEGRRLFELFGHAAICVTSARWPQGRCYNFGTSRFGDPVAFVWDFVNGRSQFWVGLASTGVTVRRYKGFNRTLWRQRLELSPEQTQRLIEALEAEHEAGSYTYHHYRDNCSTRIRDVMDDALDGALSADAMERDGLTLREFTRIGFAGRTELLAFSELFMGPAIDQPTNAWERMFLPGELQSEVEAKLGAEPELLYLGMGPPEGRQTSGMWALALAGGILGGLALLGGRIGPKTRRLMTLPTATVFGLFGSIFALLFVVSPLPELSRNWALALIWPTDLLLAVLPARLVPRYASARCGVIGLAALFSLAGLISQPLLAPAALAGLAVGGVGLAYRS